MTRRKNVRQNIQRNAALAMQRALARPVRNSLHPLYNQPIRTTVVRAPRRRNLSTIIRHVNAPGRLARRVARTALKNTAPKLYEKLHDCNREYRALLSWRKDQKKSGGGRSRTARELRNNKRNFKKRDC